MNLYRLPLAVCNMRVSTLFLVFDMGSYISLLRHIAPFFGALHKYPMRLYTFKHMREAYLLHKQDGRQRRACA
jgi:hypothetical protein